MNSEAVRDVAEVKNNTICNHLLACGHYERYSSYSFEIQYPCLASIEEGQGVKVSYAAIPHCYLSASQTDNGVVLAPENDSDLLQHWIKDDAWAKLVKDETQSPAFALINRGTLKALKHGSTENERVELSTYKIDESFLWTLSGDVGNGFECIRPSSNIRLNLTQSAHRNQRSGQVQDGHKFILSRFSNTDNQKWKISRVSPRLSSPIDKMKSNSEQLTIKLFPPGQLVWLYCEANPDFFLTSRKDEVVLIRRDDHDIHQRWVKDDSWGETYKDNAGFPAFVLVNRATAGALTHGNNEWDRVKLSPYNVDDISDEILWTQSGDVGKGYHYIRPLRNTQLNLDAMQADRKRKGIRDGNEVIVFGLNKHSNQRWRIVPTQL